jgi:hypothetical protein
MFHRERGESIPAKAEPALRPELRENKEIEP